MWGVTARNAWSVRRSHAFHTWRLVGGGTRVFAVPDKKTESCQLAWCWLHGPRNLTFGLQGFGILGFAIFFVIFFLKKYHIKTQMIFRSIMKSCFIVFRFIIGCSSLRDFYRPPLGNNRSIFYMRIFER